MYAFDFLQVTCRSRISSDWDCRVDLWWAVNRRSARPPIASSTTARATDIARRVSAIRWAEKKRAMTKIIKNLIRSTWQFQLWLNRTRYPRRESHNVMCPCSSISLPPATFVCLSIIEEASDERSMPRGIFQLYSWSIYALRIWHSFIVIRSIPVINANDVSIYVCYPNHKRKRRRRWSEWNIGEGIV